jgi:hypothetical protein
MEDGLPLFTTLFPEKYRHLFVYSVAKTWFSGYPRSVELMLNSPSDAGREHYPGLPEHEIYHKMIGIARTWMKPLSVKGEPTCSNLRSTGFLCFFCFSLLPAR